MEVTIVTFSYVLNRGAHMQCYALAKTIKQMGHKAKIVHISLPKGHFSFKGKVFNYINNIIYSLFRLKYYHNVTRKYVSSCELIKNPPKSDIYIVGSDQVWNPALTKTFGSEAFFLDFVPKEKKKIAYAASFGMSIWGKTDQDQRIKGLLHQFDAISVRELDGIDICKKTFNINNVVSVLDPVFLIEDYNNLIGKKRKIKDQVMCYPLCINQETDFIFKETIKDLGLKGISFNKHISGANIKIRNFSSIINWLKCIAQSKFVITNSFHCMAFCIIFKKQFIITPPFKGKESRITSLLDQLGLKERYIKSIEDFKDRKIELYQGINYDTVSEKLKCLRNFSLDFLKNNI